MGRYLSTGCLIEARRCQFVPQVLYGSAQAFFAKKRPCPTEALKVLPVRHWGSQQSAWSSEGSLCSLAPIQMLEDPLL